MQFILQTLNCGVSLALLFSRMRCELIPAHTGQAGMLSSPGPSAGVGLAGLALTLGQQMNRKQRTVRSIPAGFQVCYLCCDIVIWGCTLLGEKVAGTVKL